MNFHLEACVEHYEDAILMERAGAHQVELCSRLDLDGCTPFFQEVSRCLQSLTIRTKVMIRPRGGKFTFNPEVYALMKQEIRSVKKLGVEEIVLGITTEDDLLDIDHIALLRDLAYPMDITIHKAIDTCQDILEALEKLIALGGIKSVLTSGGCRTALEGVTTLQKMIVLAGQNIEIIPAGKINPENIGELHSLLQATTYHGRRILDLG